MKTSLMYPVYLKLCLILLSSLIAVSCGPDSRNRENYGDITQSPGGITLIDPNEHAGGYGRSECLMCHHASLNVHRGPNSKISDLDEFIRLVQEKGSAYCLGCHGKNGLEDN